MLTAKGIEKYLKEHKIGYSVLPNPLKCTIIFTYNTVTEKCISNLTEVVTSKLAKDYPKELLRARTLHKVYKRIQVLEAKKRGFTF